MSNILRSIDISAYHSGAASDTSLLARHAIHEDEATSTFRNVWGHLPNDKPSRPTAIDSSESR
jgi:hypothetical protein